MKFFSDLSSDLRYIMRITLSQLIIAIILSGVSYASNGIAQGILDNSVKIEKTSSSLLDVLESIEKVAAVKFVYSKNLIDLNQEVDLSANNEKLSDVLDLILKPRGINYEAFENQIVLSRLKSVDIARKSVSDITLTGTVTSTKGETLPGVSVKIKGTAIGASTNVNGAYSIKVPTAQANGTLVFTFVGFTTLEVPINGRTVINVTLEENVKSLNEVVVVGYGTQRKGSVAQAITSVDMADLKQVPVTNVSTALQGRVPGLVATQGSYRPGSGASIRIRGNRSLTATNDPLYVVDGIPITYSIDDINPLDIESIDVLKDAAATAIYGSRGANGVIQVTTKKGRSGRFTIDYSGNTSAEEILRKLEVYNGAEFAQFRRDAYIGSGVYNSTSSSNNAARRYFPDPAADYSAFNSTDKALWNNVAQGYTFKQLDPANGIFVAETRPTTAEEKALLQRLGYPVLDEVAIYDPSKITTFNWGDAALRTGTTQNHNISITGGAEKLNSAFGGGYFKQKGILPGQDYTRYSLSNSNNIKPLKFLSIGTNVNYSNAIQNQGPDVYSAATGQFPLAQPYDANGNFIFNPGGDSQVVNPLNDPNTVFNEFRINRLLSNISAQVNIVKGLSYRSALGLDLNNVRRGVFNGSVSSVRQGNAPNAQRMSENSFVWTLQNQLNYNITIRTKHDLSATVVSELRKERRELDTLRAENLTYESQKWYALQNNSQGNVVNTGNYFQSNLASVLGRVNYSYAGKYIFTAALRLDAASVLAEGNNKEYFPSASVAWRLDQEDFIKNIPQIEQLKIRAGFGAVGNSGINPFQTRGVLSGNPSYYNFGGNVALGYYPVGLPLPDLHWERTNTKNLGIDYGFFKGKISGSIDVYESNSNNIQRKSLPAAGGYTSMLVNLGKVRNRGIELALSTVNIDRSQNKRGFKWTSDFAFTRNREAIVELNETGSNDIANQWFYGQPVRNYYDFKSEGVFQYADTLAGGILKDYFWKKAGNRSNANLQPGRIRVKDITGDTIITDADKMSLGSANPNWTASINNTFSYKGFDLSAFIYISDGGLVRDIRPGLVGRYPGVKVNYWTPTNPSNDYQQPNRGSDIPLYWQSLSFRDASYVRVRSILLAYHIPAPLLSKIKVNSMTVTFNALNPFLFSKYKRYDPETVPYTSTYPSSSTANPSPTSYSYRSFVFGLRVGI
ncbi:TonB-dependent receptor [Desertivirga brevis]|uniref:TonB-dependent receptor n=1 Tax=Desertivirga brevis TaxID=2810310 RepID=UPI001A97932D|nr:TonB-dependent receptor [Pedobacter sp. SYSU D00873]